MRLHTDIRGITVLIAMCLVLFGHTTVPAWTEQEDPVDSGLPEMVVEAENQVEQAISRSRFEFEFNAALIDTFYTSVDEDVLTHSPVEGLFPFLSNPVPLGSDQIPHCWLPDPSTVPVAWFYPENPEGHKVKSWSLVVTDYRGSVFRSFTGKKDPPEKLAWDGRGDRGSMLQAGYPYSYVFSIMDKGTNTYNYAGASFRLPAIDYQEGHERRLEYSGDQIFRTNNRQLLDSGRDWLTRASDQIRQDHPYSPLTIVVMAESKTLAENRAEMVADYLIESMILPDDWIETEALERPDLRSEMDGLVSIRVNHADRSR
jgi:hypothetical protein